MRSIILIVLAVVALFWASAELAMAHHIQPSCATTEQAYAALLGGVIQERRELIGMHGGFLFEFWVNSETGTWSILLTHPDGASCLMWFGDALTYDLTGEGL